MKSPKIQEIEAKHHDTLSGVRTLEMHYSSTHVFIARKKCSPIMPSANAYDLTKHNCAQAEVKWPRWANQDSNVVQVFYGRGVVGTMQGRLLKYAHPTQGLQRCNQRVVYVVQFHCHDKSELLLPESL